MSEFIPPDDKQPTGLKYLLPLALILVWTLHFIDTTWRIIPEPVIQENRLYASKPAFNINHLDPFPEEYENFYNDHFAWRNYFIKWNAQLNVMLNKPSTFPDKVVIGKNNWLFKSGEQLKLYQGKRRFSPQELSIIANDLQSRSDSVKLRGGKYYLSFAPLKHHIYADYLPDNVLKYDEESAVEQLASYLKQNTDIHYIDLYPTFLSWRKENPNNDTLLYYKTDHHWTNFAGLMAIATLLDHFRKDFPNIPPFKKSHYPINLTEVDGLSLAQVLGMQAMYKDQWSSIEPTKPYLSKRVPREDIIPPATFGYPDEYAMDFRQDSTGNNLPSIFVNRESFANNIKNVMGDYFSKTFFLFDQWQHQFNGPMYYQEGGDIYLQLIWEGFLLNLLPEHEEETI